MENNLEDFLEEDMTKQVDDVLGTNDESYYGRSAGEVLEELEESLDGVGNDESYILYKNKKLKVRFALIDEEGSFIFEDIKPETFDFLLLIGLDKKDKFYFDILTKKDAEKKVKGSSITFCKSDFKFGSHLDYKDIENYIESHS